jgi:hypothetical protein
MATPGARPETAVRLPPDPTGVHLAVVIHDLSDAVRQGDVVIDTSAVTQHSPGLQAALRYFRRQATIRGKAWTEI